MTPTILVNGKPKEISDRAKEKLLSTVKPPICDQLDGHGYHCTRPKGHSGPHVANGTEEPMSVWKR